ncbi:hypothetical protein SDC9_157674 [bioreactor metagenome]|uniref:Uncharacterized protein n=1 Tax=bioreactor metagenome TaxID=1076179 RepID=A0A645FAL8_9ZZZZ
MNDLFSRNSVRRKNTRRYRPDHGSAKQRGFLFRGRANGNSGNIGLHLAPERRFCATTGCENLVNSCTAFSDVITVFSKQVANAIHHGQRKIIRIVLTAQPKEDAAGIRIKLRAVASDQIRQKQHITRITRGGFTVDVNIAHIRHTRVPVPLKTGAAALRSGKHDRSIGEKTVVHRNAGIAPDG